jgi:hypothetical protein
MSEPITPTEEPLKIEQLSTRGMIRQIIHGVGTALGLALLWTLEGVRDVFFHLFDRMNLRPRPKRASAFPPGRPRRIPTADAQR